MNVRRGRNKGAKNEIFGADGPKIHYCMNFSPTAVPERNYTQRIHFSN
jgi:hypothetical protein